MSKRLSSFFGHKKEKSEEGAIGSPRHLSYSSDASPNASPSAGSRLQKYRPQSPSHLSLNTHEIPSLEPPPTFRESASGITARPSSRPVSRHAAGPDYPSSRESSRSRPQTPTLLTIPGQPTSPAPFSPATPSSAASGKLAKKRLGLSGPKQDKLKFGDGDSQQKAWISGLKEHIPYDLTQLLHGDRLGELWDVNGDVVVHLYPESSGRNPTFRVHSALFAESKSLAYLAIPSINQSMQDMFLGDDDSFGPPLRAIDPGYGPQNSSIPQIMPPMSQPKVVYLPLDLEGDYSIPGSTPSGDDLELIVLYRNFFAFLGGGALISTPRQVSLFSVFMGIASILRRLAYTNADGSTYGEIPDNSFARYCDELRLGDVRSSREKTIEAIVLGEAMKHWPLYNEGFVHAAGRLDDIKFIKSPKFAKISPITVNRLERASLDVETRLKLLHSRLDDFEFPSIFSGLANSQTSTEAKLIRFKAWRLAFIDMRKFVMAQYRRRYGAWPPKAKSKKNNFDQDGLNRLLVREVYEDFCNLYDMLVNPREMTNRTIDLQPMVEEKGTTETIQHALRSMESEFDRSTPPVIPPIPFDTPLIPSLDQSFKGGNALTAHGGGSAKLKANEINELLLGSYNREYIKPSTFVQEFMAYERKLASGATLDQIVDNRCGQWLFVYVILQSLPMTAVDARGVIFNEDVEYFLFEAPRGGKPWMREDTLVSKAWYNVKSAGQTISLSADVLDHQPEGVYRRSHCWLIANQWLAAAGVLPQGQSPVQENYEPQLPSHHPPVELRASSPAQLSPAQSPMIRPMTPTAPYDGVRSHLGKSSSYTNLQVDMEQVAAPAPKNPRPMSQYNPSITFDSILGAAPVQKQEKKKKK
ncbi:hypothetical protein LTR64_006785 [Lithohypha guttulata]|uniref:uncharacterized protein n=1 Tax=Lithohypha guttulata TaxID=1690604 RepID=UPI002DE057BD|nr:hypothetical protein LTR51_004657 [Lithohypha guttulata]